MRGALVMNAHKLSHLFEPYDDRVLLVAFADGEVFRLRRFQIVDFSVYGDQDKWCAEVVEAVRGSRADFERLFPPGSGLDFVERDIVSVELPSGEIATLSGSS